MIDVYHKLPNKVLKQIFIAESGWKIVYQVDSQYYIEDIIAYAFIKNGIYYELIPLTLNELHLCQTINDYTLKDGYIGMINPQNELIIANHIIEDQSHINIQQIKEAFKKNRIKLDEI
ncbi:hypothetical protein C7H19_05885 [Aphanothece hegewaldii CCALA 016]|uniref:Uncharacterized protein n=1 Tax=Aphanothece hegewaldii CCALA 016 TaxID=2107694 RepID=A0A2T1M1G2_9CHRO|nr:hypothetical protein [Aphanothece hegewaldii]PSF38512.1 hypothetical protein C7H19_05885 [Aphanothece hegewaldii CCALA 016]